MENNYEYYSTFQYYNDKRERLSIFAEPSVCEDESECLVITAIPCSKKDSFSKKVGRKIFEDKSFKAEVVEKMVIPVSDGKPKKTFIEFCRNRYKRTFDITLEIPAKNFYNITIVKSTKL